MDHWLLQGLLMIILGLGVSFGFAQLFRNLTCPESLANLGDVTNPRRLLVVGVMLAAGPHVLFREALRARAMRHWPEAYVFAAGGLSLFWSFVLGFALLQLVNADGGAVSQNAEDIIHLLKR